MICRERMSKYSLTCTDDEWERVKPRHHRQRCSLHHGMAGEGMTDVVDAHVVEFGARANGRLPRAVDVGYVPARLGSRNDPGRVRLARQGLEQVDAGRRQVDRAGARFPVDDAELGLVEIVILPAQGADLVQAASRHQQQADRRSPRAPRPSPGRARTCGSGFPAASGTSSSR